MRTTDIIQAEIDAHEENAERTYAEYLEQSKLAQVLWSRYYNSTLMVAEWPNDETEAEYRRLSDAADATRSTYIFMPKHEYHVQIGHGGKVHRVFAPSRQWVSQPYCGSARWNSRRARIVDAPVTCEKCLK